MKIPALPFTTTDWSQMPPTEHPGETGVAYWRTASETINYRRFFDVTGLVGVRIENPDVFEARHRRILQLIAVGKVTGLRIDHPDGLFDPRRYFERLQELAATARGTAANDRPMSGSVSSFSARRPPPLSIARTGFFCSALRTVSASLSMSNGFGR